MENTSPSTVIQSSSSDCKILISLLYYSRLLQGLYLLCVLTCTTAVLVSFLVDESLIVSRITVLIEISVCSFCILELLVRFYLQGPSTFLTLSNIFDLIILSLCTINSLLSLQTKVLESLGNNTCDTLLILRNLFYLAKILFTQQKVSEDELNKLKIALNIQEEELIVRKNMDDKASISAEEYTEKELKNNDSAWEIIKSASD